jgi:hypothetical protein
MGPWIEKPHQNRGESGAQNGPDEKNAEAAHGFFRSKKELEDENDRYNNQEGRGGQ